MSLVLAVQPDADQAKRLASVCCRVGAELVTAASASEALVALGSRVPDVILSAPLLPASDELDLAEHLRSLGDRGLHVQAVGAPVLGDAAPDEPAPKGLLNAFKRPRRKTGSALCDAVTFANELSGHLLRAFAERAAITAEPIELPSTEVASAFARIFDTAIHGPVGDDLWPVPRVTTNQTHNETGRVSGTEGRLNRLRQGYDGQKADTTHGVVGTEAITSPESQLPVLAARIPNPVPPVIGPDTPIGTVASDVSRTGQRPTSDPESSVSGSGCRPAESDALLDVEQISLVDGFGDESGPKAQGTNGASGRSGKREKVKPRRRKRRDYDDAAYFDPERSEFAAVVQRFDEFARSSRGV